MCKLIYRCISYSSPAADRKFCYVINAAWSSAWFFIYFFIWLVSAQYSCICRSPNVGSDFRHSPSLPPFTFRDYFPGTSCLSCDVSRFAASTISKFEADMIWKKRRERLAPPQLVVTTADTEAFNSRGHACLHRGWQGTNACALCFVPSV